MNDRSSIIWMEDMKKSILALVLLAVACIVFTGCDTTEPEIKGVRDTVEVQCGTDFNLEQYLSDTLEIVDVTDEGTKKYKLNELEYTIKCDETVYDEDTGKVNTDHFGSYDVELMVKDESGNKTKKTFKLNLEALIIEKGFYTYQNEFDDEFSILGYCSYKNTSKDFIKITNIEFNYYDKEGVSMGTCNSPDLAPEYLDNGTEGYAMDMFTGWNMVLTDKDDVTKMKVKINYQMADPEADTTLDVGDMNMLYSYDYNVSGFAAETVVTNPYGKAVVNYDLIAGMYDKDGKLIGVMDLSDSGTIPANGKAKAITVWGPDPTTRPDLTKSVKGAACVCSFEGE